MKLEIRYKDNVHATVNAACIRGDHPLIWLQEIDRWNIPVSELECYLLPVSIQSVEASGLFVIFRDPAKAKHIELKEPYTCIEHRLFIPCNAEIIPCVNRDEWKDILLWDRQVFHPSIGLIGFEPKDEVSLANFFQYDEPVLTDWSFAHPGLAAKPVFSEIAIVQPTTEELIKSIKEEIGQKPLEDIPKRKQDEPPAWEKITDKIKLSVLKGIFKIIQAAGKVLPEGNGNTDSAGREGILQKFQNWLIRNLAELQEKRTDEIKRLLRLFDEDTQEALQYAIPLDSPYLNRGTETNSSRLSRRPIQFDLGRLGGGRAVDSWDIGNYYHDLRTKYLHAAQKEIERKDFKKAAYIYAHLLGDYYSAANTLEQGKMFREAATVYRDHLKNTAAAAECLERGGLYLEAIELNKELNKDEKTGDLYKLINQEQNAALYYEKHVETKLSHNDHLDAARVIDEKLEQGERARQVLLQGWEHTYQAESCLKKYFDIVLDTEPDTAGPKMKNVFAKSTPRHKRLLLLNVVEYVNKKGKDGEIKEITQNIAYQIVHEEAESGNGRVVHTLKNFLPGDKLISSDASRYVAGNQVKLVRSPSQRSFHLDQSIKWLKAVWHRNQFLAVGIKNSCLHLARGNWYGNLEYYSWTNPVKSNTRFTFINAPYYNNFILLHSSEGLPLTRKNLPKNKYFTEALVVYCPVWLHKGGSQFVVDGENNICRLETGDDSMTLHHYFPDGELKSSVNCSIDTGIPSLVIRPSSPMLVHHDGFYYTYTDKYFITVSEKGKVSGFGFDSLIRFFSASTSFADFRIIISTNKGCSLFKRSGGDLKMQGGLFAEQMIPSSISFVQSHWFVIVEKTKAFLFEIRDDLPFIVKEYEAHSLIVAALATHGRHEFALLEESGKMTVCEIPV